MGAGVLGDNAENLPRMVRKEVDSNFLIEKGDTTTIQELSIDDSMSFDATALRSDAVKECPLQKPTRCFYFIKYSLYEDPKLKQEIAEAESVVMEINQARSMIREKLTILLAERVKWFYELEPLILKDKKLRKILKLKMKGEKCRQGKLRTARAMNQYTSVGLCWSEEELNDLICSLRHRMQHKSKTLVEENKLLAKIKEIEGSRENVIVEARKEENHQKWRQHYGVLKQKKTIEQGIKLMDGNLDKIKMELHALTIKMMPLKHELNGIDKKASSLREELVSLNYLRSQAYEILLELQKQHDKENAHYYENRSLLRKVRELAANKDISTLEKLSAQEVECFMSGWNSSNSVRQDYSRRKLLSQMDAQHELH